MDQTLLERVDGLLQQKSDRELRQLLLARTPSEVADVIDGLTAGRRKTFAFLPPEVQADVIRLIADGSRDSILPRLPDSMIARFLHFLDEDDATDIIQQLPLKRQTNILLHTKEDRRMRIEKLLTFGPETAGGLMDLHFITVDPRATISSVITAMQEYARSHKRVPVSLLSGPSGAQWLPARVLVSAGPHTEAATVAKSVPAILHTTDREKVLDLMDREGGDIACVVDEHQKILGVIHLNDLLQVAEAEASEDMYRMGAVGALGGTYLMSNFSTIWRKRAGWLSVLFIAELFTFTALAKFESSIAAVTALALFVPLCISTGGNSGSQAATLITRAMALGDVTPRDWWRVLRRELLMGLALGLALGAVGFLRGALTPIGILGGTNRYMLGVVIAGSVATICLWGTLVGSMLPLAFKKLGFDPGYASSPFVATFVDVTGIVIYFSIANVFII